MDEYFERITAKDGAKKTFHNYKSAYVIFWFRTI